MFFSSGDSVLAFSGPLHLLGALYFPGELLQSSQQVLVGGTECFHLIRIGLYCFQRTFGRSAVYVALLVLHPWEIGVAPTCVLS